MLPEELIKKIALANGASVCGLAAAAPLAEHERFLLALKELPPSLAYLAREPQKRADIRNWFSGARSVLMCGFSYCTPGLDHKKTLESVGEPEAFLKRSGRKILQPGFFKAGNRRIARYALAPDYHAEVKKKLLKIIKDAKAEFPGFEGRAFVDTSPVLEKELGRLAGLGFRGKNTLLINPRLGSYFVLGGVALNMEFAPDQVREGGCGGCELCVKACPAGALKDGGLLSAKCVSYLTTQAKEAIPEGAVSNSGGFAYGCDICQEACPYNG